MAIHSVARWSAGGEAEPLLDYAVMSLLLLLLLPAGALAIMLVSLAAKGPTETWLDIITFAILSAGACGGLLTLIDWHEGYFTQPGIQGFATMAGATVGALYGAAVGMVCLWMTSTRHDPTN